MIDVVPNAGVIALGKQGENQAVRVTLPNIRAGAGSILLLHQRAADQQPYPVPVVEANGGIIWTVSSTDTAYPGRGQAELQWLGADGAVVKSVTYQTNIIRALTTPGAVPDEPLKPYTQAVAKDAQAAKNAAASATEAARSAGASATQAGLSADNAAKTLKKLEDGIASGDFRGQDGKSAYQLAVDAGFDGTETQWLESLKGAPGDTTAADAAAEAARKAAQEAQKAAETAVLYTEQHLTDSQQEQARSNINAADKARQNILVGTETGNPITVDDAFSAPLCGLTVYGKSTQDGTPSPDNPVPIVRAGDGGSVAVTVTGANVLEGTKLGVKSAAYGVTYTTYENGILITGTATNDFSIALHDDMTHRLTRGIYYLTTSGLSPSVVLNFYFIGKFSSDLQNQKVVATRDVEFSLRLQILKGATLNTTVQVSLTRNKITAYSPYREQLLTLQTPTGLPGIPVTSGGNYTDQNGQRWICDEIDLERGMMVQRVYKVDVDGENVKFKQADRYANLFPGGLPIALHSVGQKTYAASTFTSSQWFFNMTNGNFLYLIENNISDQLNESCKKQPGKVYYALATPIETPLTADEIAAYKALTAYAPDTVVQASDGAGVKLDYQRDVNIAIQRLEDAIASMTAT